MRLRRRWRFHGAVFWIRFRFPICARNWACNQLCSSAGRRRSPRTERPPSSRGNVLGCLAEEKQKQIEFLEKKVQAQDEVLAERVAEHIALKKVLGNFDRDLMGEPFPSQAEMAGFGRVLFQAREYWPDYMSCILVVRQDLIDTRPEAVQVLVDGIARSGLWLDTSRPHREDAADFVGHCP
jgi:hypothetical protein